MKSPVLVALCAFVPMLATAQGVDCVPLLKDVKRAALAAKAANSGDFAVIKAMDKAAGVDTAYATQNPAISLSRVEGLSAFLTLPFLSYRLAVSEALRKREPIETIELPQDVVLAISPDRIDAPDIIKVIATRDGVDIPPIRNTLKPTELTTRIGARVVLHSGELFFPCQAFDGTADVTVTLIPNSGSNIRTTVPRSRLAIFKSKETMGF